MNAGGDFIIKRRRLGDQCRQVGQHFIPDGQDNPLLVLGALYIPACNALADIPGACIPQSHFSAQALVTRLDNGGAMFIQHTHINFHRHIHANSPDVIDHLLKSRKIDLRIVLDRYAQEILDRLDGQARPPAREFK